MFKYSFLNFFSFANYSSDVMVLLAGCVEFMRQSFAFEEVLQNYFGVKHSQAKGEIKFMNPFASPYITVSGYRYEFT